MVHLRCNMDTFIGRLCVLLPVGIGIAPRLHSSMNLADDRRPSTFRNIENRKFLDHLRVKAPAAATGSEISNSYTCGAHRRNREKSNLIACCHIYYRALIWCARTRCTQHRTLLQKAGARYLLYKHAAPDIHSARQRLVAVWRNMASVAQTRAEVALSQSGRWIGLATALRAAGSVTSRLPQAIGSSRRLFSNRWRQPENVVNMVGTRAGSGRRCAAKRVKRRRTLPPVRRTQAWRTVCSRAARLWCASRAGARRRTSGDIFSKASRDGVTARFGILLACFAERVVRTA